MKVFVIAAILLAAIHNQDENEARTQVKQADIDAALSLLEKYELRESFQSEYTVSLVEVTGYQSDGAELLGTQYFRIKSMLATSITRQCREPWDVATDVTTGVWHDGVMTISDGEGGASHVQRAGTFVDMDHAGLSQWFNRIPNRYNVAVPGYIESIRAGQVLWAEVSDGIVRCRFFRSDPTVEQIEVTGTLEPEVTIDSIRFFLSSSADSIEEFEDRIMVTQEFTILEWADYGDVRLPRLASLVTKARRSVDSEWFGNHFEYVRTRFAPIKENDIDPEALVPVATPGMRVTDRDLAVFYRIGQPELIIDSTTYQASEPITDFLDRQSLEAYLSMAQVVVRKAPPNRGSSSPDQFPQRSFASMVLFVAAVGVGVMLLVYVGLGQWRKRGVE